MAFGNATFANASGAVSDLFQSQATADGLRLKAKGSLVEGENYDRASVLADRNAMFAEESTGVKQLMADRQILQGIGREEADIAGAGFANTGSAIDLLRSSSQQGALQKQLIGRQGLITEEGYREQSKSYSNLAEFSRMSATTQNQMADRAETSGYITSALKGAAAFATMYV
jgi:hypothetical protein